MAALVLAIAGAAMWVALAYLVLSGSATHAPGPEISQSAIVPACVQSLVAQLRIPLATSPAGLAGPPT
jgi:hypothetical protein